MIPAARETRANISPPSAARRSWLVMLRVKLPKPLIGRLETRVQCQGTLPGHASGLEIPKAIVGMSEQMVRMPVPRIQRTRLAKILHRILEPPTAQFDEPYTAVQISKIGKRIDREKVPVGLDRLVDVSSRQLHVPEVAIGPAGARGRCDGFAKCCRSLIITSVALQGHSALVRSGGDTVTEHCRGDICAPPHDGWDCEQTGDQQKAPRSPQYRIHRVHLISTWGQEPPDCLLCPHSGDSRRPLPYWRPAASKKDAAGVTFTPAAPLAL